MNDFNINTRKSEIGMNVISNVYSFTSISGDTSINYVSTSTDCIQKVTESDSEKKNRNFYTIILDWFQFVCETDKIGSLLESYSTDRISIVKKQTNNNPNFRFRYIISIDGSQQCEIFTIPNNQKHKRNEVLVKISNSQLYTSDWTIRIYYLMNELDLSFKSLTRIDIAIDGNDILRKMDLFRRYLRTKTIRINNENLVIDGVHFNKQKLNWDSYTVGSKKYQKTAVIYNKTAEIKVSGKEYISEYWHNNSLNISDEVGRFELKLGTRHLNKYKFNSFNDFCDAGYLSQILHAEMINWLRFYQVSLDDAKNHRKDIAIRKGKELTFIHWDKLPQTMNKLEQVSLVSDGIQEAKRVITHTINEIQKGYTIDSTETLIRFVEVITTEYNLYYHSIKRLGTAIKRNPSGNRELIILWKKLKDN